MQISFFIKLGFRVEDLEFRYYKDYISKNKIKDRKYDFMEF